MRYKTLGKTGLEVSVLAVGTWAIGGTNWGEVNKKDSIDAIHAMIDNGVNFIDTAPTYGFGHSEEVVGEALQGKRDDVILLTKCGIRWDEGPKNFKKGATRDSSRESILKQCEESLKRLQTDHFDFYIIHWPDVNTPLEETASALEELKKQGKIRFCGVSNFEKDLIDEFEKLGMMDVVQLPYSMVNRTREAELIDYAKRGMGTMSYGSLGAGILTGAIRELPKFSENDARLGFYDFFVEPKFFKVMKLLKTLDVIAEKRNVPVAHVAVNWITQSPFICTSLVGVRNPAEANENCSGTEWELTDAEIAQINKAIEDTLGK